MVYKSEPGNVPHDDFTESESESGPHPFLALFDAASGMLREMFPRCPRFMTDSLWGYLPGVLLATFFISMWEFSDDHNPKVLELNHTVMNSFRSMDEVRDRLGDEYFSHYTYGGYETLIYSYSDWLHAITTQEFDCFSRKYRKRIRSRVSGGKINKSPTRIAAWAEKSALIEGNTYGAGVRKRDLTGTISVSRVRRNTGPDSVAGIRNSWISDVMTVALTPEETDRFTSITVLRIMMFQGCGYDDYYNDD